MNLRLRPAVASMVSSGLVFAAPLAAANPCSPSSARLRTPMQLAQNPCAAKNPCAAAGVDRKLVTRPKGTKPYSAPRAQLVSAGKQLWSDTKLSTNGMSCNTCHQGNAAFGPTFARPYPHRVAMAEQQSKLKSITAEQMVQFCMIVPMAAKPLPWGSKELAALTAYSGEVQKDFITKK